MSSKKFNQREVRLKILMLKSGLKGNAIAKATNYSPDMVSRYLKGERNSKRLDEFFDKLKNKK